MGRFEFRVDTDTIYFKAIRFLGALLLGFFIGVISMNYKFEGTVDWLNAFSGITISIVFAFYPGAAKNRALVFDDKGLYLRNYYTFWDGKKEYHWSSVKAIQLNKNSITLAMQVGSEEQIKLPIYTKEQIADLKEYINELSATKDITFQD